MAITAEDIQNQTFSIDRRGYNVDEMDVFLERVAQEVDALNNEIASLRQQLAEMSSSPAVQAEPTIMQNADLAAKDARIAELERRLEEKSSDDSVIAQALIVAQRTADEIISKSKAEAEQTRRNAEEEARRILDKAGAEKQRVVEHINDLNESREQIRIQYQDLLKEFITVATQRLTEIGGDITEGFSMPELSDDSADQYVDSSANSVKWEPATATATYTTPTVNPVVSAPAAPKPSASSKDLSGYGAADDSFSFDEID